MSSESPEKIPTKEEQNEELRQVFPFFKNWKALYRFVLIELAVVILLLYLFIRAFS